jgi:hypothetical protein
MDAIVAFNPKVVALFLLINSRITYKIDNLHVVLKPLFSRSFKLDRTGRFHDLGRTSKDMEFS